MNYYYTLLCEQLVNHTFISVAENVGQNLGLQLCHVQGKGLVTILKLGLRKFQIGNNWDTCSVEDMYR